MCGISAWEYTVMAVVQKEETFWGAHLSLPMTGSKKSWSAVQNCRYWRRKSPAQLQPQQQQAPLRSLHQTAAVDIWHGRARIIRSWSTSGSCCPFGRARTEFARFKSSPWSVGWTRYCIVEVQIMVMRSVGRSLDQNLFYMGEATGSSACWFSTQITVSNFSTGGTNQAMVAISSVVARTTGPESTLLEPLLQTQENWRGWPSGLGGLWHLAFLRWTTLFLWFMCVLRCHLFSILRYFLHFSVRRCWH